MLFLSHIGIIELRAAFRLLLFYCVDTLLDHI